MIWLSLACQRTVMRAEPGVIGVISSGRRVAGLRMWRWPVAEPVNTFEEVGEKRMLVVGYCEDVEGCSTVVMGVLNFRVSQSLMVSSPPRVITSLPSPLISRPPVQVSFTCASLISAAGRLYGP